MYTTLIKVDELLGLPPPRIVDCRFDLSDAARGYAAYLEGHIPGAVYAHLERDLSAPPNTDCGRHPLPSPQRLVEVFGTLGIGQDQQVVVYDDLRGSIAARLWWMLRYMGHDSVALLDGGWQAWCAAAGPTRTGDERVAPTNFGGAVRAERLATLSDVVMQRALVDARDPVRYRGERELINPRAGHIPGALNHFWQHNLRSDGCYHSPDALREAFRSGLGTLPHGDTVHYCGSGVTACHNVLAQVHAGLPEPRLYCGSWSEWCRDPERPIALGEYCNALP